MPGQKGSLLDKIKAFFVRRKQNAIKKKELERKDLEEILKNISDKVIPTSGIVVRTAAACDKLDLKNVSLNTPKSKIHIVSKIDEKKNIDTKVVNDVDVLDLDDMSLSNLKQLKSSIVGGVDNNKSPNIEDKVIVDSSKDFIINPIVSNQLNIDDSSKIDDIKISTDKDFINKSNNNDFVDTSKNTSTKIEANDKKDSFKRKLLFVSKEKLVVDSKKVSNVDIKINNTKGYNFNKNRNKNKSTEEELSAILIRMIDKNLYELDYLKSEIEFLKDSNEKARTKEEMFEIEQRFLILKERLEAVYREFLKFRDSDVFRAELPDIRYNEEFVSLVQKYKLDITDNDVIKQALVDIENKYKTNLNILESIVALEESKEVLGDDIYNNKYDISVRDEELQLTGDTLEKIEFMKSEIEKNIDQNNYVISSAIDKINSIRPEERVRLRFNIVNNLINSALSFSFSFAMMNPRRGRLANAVGAVSMLNGVRSLARVFQPERQIYYVASNDFSDEIKEHLNDFSYVKKNIDLSIEEIDKIKLDFDDKFKQYIDDIPEANEAYKKINELQDQLKDIKIQMNLQENILENSLAINNSMVKKIEYQNDTEH